MLKLKLQYFGHLMQSTYSVEKTISNRNALYLQLSVMNECRVWEKGTTEDEIVEWYHQLDGHEFEQTPGVVLDREASSAAVPGSQRVVHD